MRRPSPPPRRAASPPPRRLLLLLAALVPLLAPKPAAACTRVLYQGDNNTVITGRTLDWLEDSQPSLWAFPRGLARNGSAGPGSITWTSKHGSLVVSMYGIATLDGMNEKGLVGNALYLVRGGGG
jgi:choloylglycine hydrolase